MASEHWFRWHHGTVTDPKWRIVAKRASNAMSRNVTVGHVLSVWASMLENASQSSPRGELSNWSDEDIGVALDIEQAEVTAIREAMHGKTLDRDVLIAWNRRQIKQEDDTAAKRKAAQREREKSQLQNVESRDIVESHDVSRDVPVETETETEKKDQKLSAELRPADVGICDPDQPPTDAPKRQRRGDSCPVAQIVALYHELLPMCPRVEKITKAREGYIRQRWLEDLPTLDAWRAYLTDVAGSRFLTGLATPAIGKPPFVANLEWLTRPGNFAKVAEGTYHR